MMMTAMERMRGMTGRVVGVLAGVFVGAAVLAGGGGGGALAGEPLKGPCVAFPRGPLSGEAVVWWETAAPGEGFLRYAAGGRIRTLRDPARSSRHEIALGGLRPGQTVRYEIGGSGVSSAGSFKVPARDAERLRFAVIGDPRAYDSAAKAMLPLLAADKPDLVIATGDYVHKG